MKHNYKALRGVEDKKAVASLWSAINKADQKGNTEKFLRELLTDNEQLMLGRRVLISSLLLQGYTQVEIREMLKLSPNTTWKVKQWLDREIPEYGKVLQKLDQESRENWKKKRKIYMQNAKPFTFAYLKQKYPAHFLLFNLADEIFQNK